MIKHIHVRISDELERIANGKGTMLGNGNDIEANNVLVEAQNKGKEFWSGCDNMKDNGMCGGHIT